MPLDYKTYPEENSLDLTDEEIAGATETLNPPDFRDKLHDALIHLSCGSCGGPATKFHSSLKRRKPHVFSRTDLTCANGHTWRKTFQIDWLGKKN
jgi:hypothetical protein